MSELAFTCATCGEAFPIEKMGGRNTEGYKLCLGCAPHPEVTVTVNPEPEQIVADLPTTFECPWCLEYGNEPTVHPLEEAAGLDGENRPVCHACVEIKVQEMVEAHPPETREPVDWRPAMQARRLKALILNPDHFAMLAEGSVIEVARNDLPEGAVCVGTHYHAPTHLWWLTFMHDSFAPVEVGQEVPTFDGDAFVLRARPAVGLAPGDTAEAEKILGDILESKNEERRERLTEAERRAYKKAKKQKRTSKDV